MNHSAPRDNPALSPVAESTLHFVAENYERTKRLRRKHFAAASVVPGALLLVIVVAIKIPAGIINLLVTAILGLVFTAMMAGSAYAFVDAAPWISRSRVTAAIAVAVNLTYLAMLGVFALQ